MLTAESTKDWGPDANIYKCTGIPDDEECIPLSSTGTLDASTVLRLSCFDTSQSKWTSDIGRDIYLRGLTDFENALRAKGTVANIDNVECSFDDGFNTSDYGASCINLDNDQHTYWNGPNTPGGWALFSGSAAMQNTLRHCNSGSVTKSLLRVYVGRPSLAQTPSVSNPSYQIISVSLQPQSSTPIFTQQLDLILAQGSPTEVSLAFNQSSC